MTHGDPDRARRRTVFALAASAAAPGPVLARSYPARPVTLVVPYSSGAAMDALARALAHELEPRLGVRVIVENLGGASGMLGVRRVLRARPDGYTLLLANSNELVLVPLAMNAVGYDWHDLTPVSVISRTKAVLVASSQAAADTADAWRCFAERSERPLTVGFVGPVSYQALGAFQIADQLRNRLTQASYSAGSAIVGDLRAGHIDVAVLVLPSIMSLIQSSRLKSLGVLSTARDSNAPELATINESRFFREVHADLMAGLLAPSSTPRHVLEKLAGVVNDVLGDEAFRARQAMLGNSLEAPLPLGAFSRMLEVESHRVRALALAMSASDR